MIIWINGAFGAGKSSVADVLHEIHPDSYIYDPENIGAFLREHTPKSMRTADFQDMPLWREYNYKLLKYINDGYGGIIIVPMTLTNPTYFNEIIGQLRHDGAIVNHCILSATKENLISRLQKRDVKPTDWPVLQIDRCLGAFSKDIEGDYIDTNSASIEQIARLIANKYSVN